MVAAMTPGRAFRRAPQAPPEALVGQARTGQARPGRAAPRPDQVSRPEAAAVRPPRSRWTRPPSSSRIPQPERLSTRHLRGAAPTAGARPHATARQAPIPPPAPQAVRVRGRRRAYF